MTESSFVKTVVTKAYTNFSQNPGNFLLWSGSIGWVASCISQLVAISNNDKLTGKQKKFLIPQEITDGVVNTLLFAAFTRSFTKIGEKLVHNGKWATKELAGLYKTTKVPHLGNKTIDELIGIEVEVDKNGKKVKQLFHIGDTVNKLDPTEAENGISKKYWPFATGVVFTFSTLGSVVACDAVTPFVRNKIASYQQKKALAKEQALGQNEIKTVSPIAPTQPLQNPYQSKTPLASAYRPTGSMKI